MQVIPISAPKQQDGTRRRVRAFDHRFSFDLMQDTLPGRENNDPSLRPWGPNCWP
jgi:hypothetical protein